MDGGIVWQNYLKEVDRDEKMREETGDEEGDNGGGWRVCYSNAQTKVKRITSWGLHSIKWRCMTAHRLSDYTSQLVPMHLKLNML